jgi:hypothetical protein
LREGPGTFFRVFIFFIIKREKGLNGVGKFDFIGFKFLAYLVCTSSVGLVDSFVSQNIYIYIYF